MSILNVRLGADDQRLASELRADGVAISRVVREAIRAEHRKRLGARGSSVKPSVLVEALLTAHPAPDGYRRPGPDPRDRRAVRAWIAGKVTHESSRSRKKRTR